MDRTAVFPGSFDPFTLGHKAIVEKALSLFDRIVIGVGNNSEKRSFISPHNRVRMIERIFQDEGRIEVRLYDGLTGDFCRENGIRFIIRGIRNATDYEYEHAMEMVNARMFPEITTVTLFTPPELAPVSSRLIREIVSMGGDASLFLPEEADIKDYL